MIRHVKKFKGGSLSSTNLVSDESGSLFVRKDVSITSNREYGFQRWYSQLKRLQRYSVLFPNIYPNILKFGKIDDYAYFDMEYIDGAVNAHDFIESCNDSKIIDSFFDELIRVLSIIHDKKIKSNPEAIELYIYEEIDQRIKDCNSNKNFSDFKKYKEIYFNNKLVNSFLSLYDDYKQMLTDCYSDKTETFTHGNITLENMMYVPHENRIILIDPYEENVVDSVLAEYSQLLQSTNSKYEIYNRLNANIDKNRILLDIPDNFGIDYLNAKILNHISSNYSKEDYFSIRLLEISQFIRMLPFKMAVDESKMIFFYGLASYLFHSLNQEYKLYKKK